MSAPPRDAQLPGTSLPGLSGSSGLPGLSVVPGVKQVSPAAVQAEINENSWIIGEIIEGNRTVTLY